MTPARIVAVVLLLVSVLLTGWGLTDSKVTELLYGSWAPGLVGLLVLAFSGPKHQRVTFTAADWKVPPAQQPVLQQLALAHDFTPEEFEANRRGELTAAQREAGIRLGRGDVIFGAVLLVVAAAVVAASLPALKGYGPLVFVFPEGKALLFSLVAGGVLAVTPALLGGVALRHGLRVVRAFRAGRVEWLAGPLQLLEVRRRRQGSGWFYLLGDRQLAVTEQGWKSVVSGATYRVCVVPGVDRVLCLEPG